MIASAPAPAAAIRQVDMAIPAAWIAAAHETAQSARVSSCFDSGTRFVAPAVTAAYVTHALEDS